MARRLTVTKRTGACRAAGPLAVTGRASRPGDGGRLKTEDGLAAYRQRGLIAEAPHGHIKHLRFRPLSVRGKAAAEWAFTAAVHNLLKAITSGHLTAQALPA